MNIYTEVFEYLDKKGIPYSLKSKGSIKNKTNSYNEEYINDDSSYNLITPQKEVFIELPFDISQEKMQSLVIDYIYDTTGIKLKNVSQILCNPTYQGKPFILQLNGRGAIKKVHLAKRTIPESLIVSDANGYEGLTSLGIIERIQGHFGVLDVPIKDLGKLQKVYKDMRVVSYNYPLKLKTLSPIKIIGGNLTVKGKGLESLGTLEEVGGNVSIRNSTVKDLGNLKIVGGNLLMSTYNKQYLDVSNIDVRGEIKYYNDKYLV